ncbi:putative AbiEii toxin of type IV toxin-antitoxin system [Pseudacidovorax intermedius]|uniref:Putative AbiEii toxin of type IV toxin-antitoxin system n=1 Tax=Pseudacidovorax intermedius TaxID=433924 RepID=A0A370F883_9BURK|nr:AAA family ATPase [Pseudacidovorax intermedius]RDI20712.1 putative AbiEii toxin of type IV toxin-antitoxin system [Pseudacidovorax intermedius]
MKFMCFREGENFPRVVKPYVFLVHDNWDDFGYKVSFKVFVTDGIARKAIGTIKILQKISERKESFKVASQTELPERFDKLSDDYISLGQERSYYEEMRKFFDSEADVALNSLRDIALLPRRSQPFEPTSAYRNALMRHNSAQRAKRFGAAWARGEDPQEQVSFTYAGKIDGAEMQTIGRFDFDENDELPGRVVAIIGRNASGKTNYIASLAADLASTRRTSGTVWQEREKRFTEGRPLFTRVLAVSYSAFDNFKRPRVDERSSYVYCGIGGENSHQFDLTRRYIENRERIRQIGRQGEWRRYIQDVIESDNPDHLSDDFFVLENSSMETQTHLLSLLSSGQAIFIHFITALLAWLEPYSLVVFDEPETHLHPNAVANLFLVLSSLLDKYDSFAIIATHSPLVVQEVPAKRVLVFRRTGNITETETLGLESFGESISEITKHVFETVEVDSVYRRTLRKLARKYPLEEALGKFDTGLSINAEAYLLAQYGARR